MGLRVRVEQWTAIVGRLGWASESTRKKKRLWQCMDSLLENCILVHWVHDTLYCIDNGSLAMLRVDIVRSRDVQLCWDSRILKAAEVGRWH